MGFRLVPKSVILNDLERRNGHVAYVISPNSVAFCAYLVKVIEDRQIHSASEMWPKESSFQRYITWRCSQGITPSDGVKVDALL